jgi:hypothetical protein
LVKEKNTSSPEARFNSKTLCAFCVHLCAFCDQCINHSSDSFSFLCFFGESAVWPFCRQGKFVTHERLSVRAFSGEMLGMHVAKRPPGLSMFRERKMTMKTVVSFVLGAVMLFGAATLGLQSASVSAKDKHDKNYWKHHQHRRHRHHKHRKNHLSY